MLKNLLWAAGGLGTGLLIWLLYTQYKKAKDKRAAEQLAAAAAETAAETIPTATVTTADNTAATPVKM